MGTILLVVLLLLLVGALPSYSYSRRWGYAPSGVFGLLLVVLLVGLFFSPGHWWFGSTPATLP